MTLHSRPAQLRQGRRGFTLLEVLIALSVAASVLATILPLLPLLAGRTQQRIDRLVASEFAYSVLEEYRVTYPLMDANGTSAGWVWSVEERSVAPAGSDGLSEVVSFHEVTATVWKQDAAENKTTMSTLVARRMQ